MAIKDGDERRSSDWERRLFSHWIGVYLDLLDEGDENAVKLFTRLSAHVTFLPPQLPPFLGVSATSSYKSGDNI